MLDDFLLFFILIGRGILIIAATAAVFGAMLGFMAFLKSPSGMNRSRYFNRFNGKYRVRYNDGSFSEPMCHDVAESYALVFNGHIEKIGKKKAC